MVLLLFTVPESKVLAQDPQLSQFHIADLLVNPALAGSKLRNRVMFHQRLQWLSLQGQYNTSFFSFDTYLHDYNLGIGSYLIQDSQGEGILKTTNWNVLGSYDLSLTEVWSLRFGMQLGIAQKVLNDNGLIYPSQVTSTGIVQGANSGVGTLNYSQADFSTGAVLSSKKFWFSVSFAHLNKPRQKFLNGNEVFPHRGDFIVGHKFPLAKITPGLFTGYVKEFFVFPTIHYKYQGESDQLELGADVIDEQLRLGVWYRGIPTKKYRSDLHNNESFIFLIGWRYGPLEFAYSYDAVISRLQRASTGGAHEIHISFVWPEEIRRKNYKELPCPDFQRSMQYNGSNGLGR